MRLVRVARVTRKPGYWSTRREQGGVDRRARLTPVTKILVTGARGQLGGHLLRRAAGDRIPARGVGPDELDITDADAVNEQVEARIGGDQLRRVHGGRRCGVGRGHRPGGERDRACGIWRRRAPGSVPG